MMTVSKILLSVVVVLLCKSPSVSCNSYRTHPTFVTYIHNTRPRTSENSYKHGDDEEFVAAETAAAIDAHDVSDAGMEGAAMEAAVVMAADMYEEKQEAIEREHAEKPRLFTQKMKSIFRTIDLIGIRDTESQYAKKLSDVAALEHANQVAATDTVSDPAAVIMSAAKYQADKQATPLELQQKTKKMRSLVAKMENLLSVVKSQRVKQSEANYAKNISDTAAIEHANEVMPPMALLGFVGTVDEEDTSLQDTKTKDELHIASVEEHYKSMDKDIKTIERLIKEAAEVDKSDGHTLERTFSDDDASDMALMMLEKSILAATDKLELCQAEAEQTEAHVKAALEEKYSAKAVAESIERERHAVEDRFLATEHFDDHDDVLERLRDSSILHSNDDLLADVHQQEHEAELKLEKYIEEDIAAKQELEQMIENKAILKQELHDLEQIIHEHTVSLWDKENAKKAAEDKKKHPHHFDWWHKRW
eukprot:182082_1